MLIKKLKQLKQSKEAYYELLKENLRLRVIIDDYKNEIAEKDNEIETLKEALLSVQRQYGYETTRHYKKNIRKR